MIGILACSKTKLPTPAPAVELYQGRTFRAVYLLLRALGCQRFVILSALHGPVDENTVIAPYERTLIGARKAELDAWNSQAAPKLRELVGAKPSVAIVPQDYAGALVGLPGCRRLLKGLPQGKLYAAVREALDNSEPWDIFNRMSHSELLRQMHEVSPPDASNGLLGPIPTAGGFEATAWASDMTKLKAKGATEYEVGQSILTQLKAHYAAKVSS